MLAQLDGFKKTVSWKNSATEKEMVEGMTCLI